MKNAGSDYKTLVFWSPAANSDCQQDVESLDALQKVFEGSSVNSKYIENSNLSFFKSAQLGNYQLAPGFPAKMSAAQLPLDVEKLLGLPKKYSPYIGAYPVKQ